MIKLHEETERRKGHKPQPRQFYMSSENTGKIIDVKSIPCMEYIPQPEELWQNCSNKAIYNNAHPYQFIGKLKCFKPGIVQQEEPWPQQQQIKQSYKTWI